jgi:hypothetical protein
MFTFISEQKRKNKRNKMTKIHTKNHTQVWIFKTSQKA